MNQLVLSLFPGIGMLDMAFEEQGFCIVRGPDLLWGGDIKTFKPPAEKFDGVIGGPPCQRWSRIARLNTFQGRPLAECLIPEFERCISEAQPDWFLMENVEAAPTPQIKDYITERRRIKDVHCGGETKRAPAFATSFACTRFLFWNPPLAKI